MAVFSLGASGDDAISVEVVDEEYVFGVRSMYAQDIGGCLLPLSNVVKDLQDAGALAVLFIKHTHLLLHTARIHWGSSPLCSLFHTARYA